MFMNQRKSYIFALSAIFLWSTAAIAFKFALEHFDFMQMVFFSSVVASIVIFSVVLVQNKIGVLLKSSKKNILRSALNGLLNPFGYYLILLKAYSLLPAQLAQPLNYTWPIALVFLAVPFLKQKVSRKNFIALIISFTGVIFISLRDEFNFDIQEPFGVLLATGSSLIWAMYWILNVKDKREESVKLFLNFLFGTIYAGIFVLIFSDFSYNNIQEFLPIIYIGFFEMGFTFVLWMKAMQLTKSTDKIGNLVFISPFISLIWISIFLKESIYYTTVIGLIFIVVGILIQQKRQKVSDNQI